MSHNHRLIDDLVLEGLARYGQTSDTRKIQRQLGTDADNGPASSGVKVQRFTRQRPV